MSSFIRINLLINFCVMFIHYMRNNRYAFKTILNYFLIHLQQIDVHQ